MKHILENKFWQAVRYCAAVAVFGIYTSNLYAADTTVVSHSEYQFGFENFIMDDVDADGNHNADVYVLESGVTYYQRIPLRLESSCEIMGDYYDDLTGGSPATIQQIVLDDGSSGFDNWPASNILTYGANQHYKIHNLLFNQMIAGSEASTFGVMATYGNHNTIIVDNVTSIHSQVITYFNFGQRENWILTNNKAVQYTSYPYGMFFGGFFWGGGAWTGTLESMTIQNNTIEGTWGQAFLFYDNGLISHNETGNMIHVDHNTFVNIGVEHSFNRVGNNSVWTNNLFVNNNAIGQTSNSANTNLSFFNDESGAGKMYYSSQLPCYSEELMNAGECWDIYNRNIHYQDNGWYDTPELLAHYSNSVFDGWCWNLTSSDGTDSTDANGNVISLCDTMLSVTEQSKWVGDSTVAQFANNISETNTINPGPSLEFGLAPEYAIYFTERAQNYFLNGGFHNDQYTDYSWMYQPDGDTYNVEWPLQMNFAYNADSDAYDHADGGYPLGDLNAFPNKKAEWLNEQNSLAGTSWKMAPFQGALKVGPGIDDGSWWQSSLSDVENRGCFFDDHYKFNSDGSFENILGEETWVESWQDDQGDGCRAPVAPHDGSADASFTFTDETVTIHGVGAFLGIAKAITGGELGNPADAPDSVTYNILYRDGSDAMGIYISTGSGYWTFHLVNSDFVPQPQEMVNITFNLDMSSVETSDDGAFVGGGALFGGPHDNWMNDDDGDGIWTITIAQPANSGSNYVFLNGVCDDWSCKEDLAGQDCADPNNWNDRFLEWGDEDVEVNACFGVCGDGVCADLIQPPVDVVFNTDASWFNAENGVVLDTIWATGSFDGWSGWGVPLTDPDGNGVYKGVIQMIPGTVVEYKYILGGWSVESGAELGSECDLIPEDEYNNFGFVTEDHNMVLPVYRFGLGCETMNPGPFAGSGWNVSWIGVGPTIGSGDWYNLSAANDTTRNCYWDDTYFFHPNGDFNIDFHGNTWVENWQDGQGDGCRAPVAPHDGSNPAGFSYDGEGSYTVHGVGSFIGLPKAINNAEINNPADAPGSITYNWDYYDDDMMVVWVDISDTGGSGYWTYILKREVPQTLVTLWLEADDVPCGGNPWVSGTFNEWNPEGDTMYEMSYDSYWNEFYVALYLDPGYYEYKFHCYDDGINWTDEETVPAECGVLNQDSMEEYHRFINVPALPADDWYEAPTVAWGGCPDIDPCYVVDCENLQMVHIVGDSIINDAMAYLTNYDMTPDSAMNLINAGIINMYVWDFGNNENGPHYEANFYPEFSDFENNQLVYIAEWPGGIPDSIINYYWVWGIEALETDIIGYEWIFDPEESCVMPLGGEGDFLTRYWDPQDHVNDLNNDDVHPTEYWPIASWNSCEFDDGGGGPDDDNVIYLGNFQGHDYYQVNHFVPWWVANDSASAWGGYLATITSPEENEFLYNNIDWNVNFEMYMGLYDATSDNNGWTWVTGEPFNYQNWDDGQPDCPGCQDYGVIWESGNGKWDDGNADLPFIVEFGEPVIPDPPVLTNYSIDIVTASSFYNGTDNSLPELDINDGLHISVTFDTSGPGPYMGYATGFLDANFSGELDEGDQNIANNDWENDEDAIYVILDNGPNDQNSLVGIYEEDAYAQEDENQNLQLQGATFFYVALDTNLQIVDVQAVSPFSSSTQRISGDAMMAHDSTQAVPGLIFTVWSNNGASHGITGPDGHYDIGVDLGEDSWAYIYYDQQGQGSDGRLLPLFWNSSYYGGMWSGWSYYSSVPAEGVYVYTQVMVMNTLVYGQLLDPMGNPVASDSGYVDVNKYVLGDSSGYMNNAVWDFAEVDENGHYSFWTMNGTENAVFTWNSDFGSYDSTFYVFSDMYDDELGAYLFEHNIQFLPLDPGPPVNLINNGGFEQGFDWWTIYPYDAGNFSVEGNGSPIYNSPNEATLEVFEGEHALKMWGGYHSEGYNWTDSYQSHYDYVNDGVGANIHASARLMSHQDDWIGTLDSSVHAGTNKVYLFVSYWDEYGNFIHWDTSQPFDGTFAASEWHHIEVSSMVPEGTHKINIGISFNQNDWSNGSVYIDDFHSSVGLNFVETGTIAGYVNGEMYDEDEQSWYMTGLANVPVEVYSESNYYITHTDEWGYYSIDVPAWSDYYVNGPELPDLYTNDFHMVWVEPGSHSHVDIWYFTLANQYYTLSGRVIDTEGNPINSAQVQALGVSDPDYWNDTYTYEDGYFDIEVPYGVYDIKVYYYGYLNVYTYDVEVYDYTYVGDIVIELVTEFDGAAQGVITFIGNEPPDGNAWMYITNDFYQSYVNVDDNGFYYADLVDGIYNVYANAPGYNSVWINNAFEVSGNVVVFNFELYQEGYAGPPHIVDLHDVPNDQGRQMRTVWHSGMAGDWDYFTQFSIWRKVNGAPVDLWDYVETVPWHGDSDPYAAVVPTLGDSSMYEQHLSTFIVTAHTEDVNFYIDSEPVSGYSIDNLHPGAPMNFIMSTDPGVVSLSWTRHDDEDFDYHNIYRREIASDEPAMVFTTVDSFYVDQDVEESGAYEYWITSVDMSGLESDPSNSVSAVLSADEKIGLPTEFALKQNYPNPFNPSTQIQYALPEDAMVTISIYDLMGRKVRTLVDGVQDAGYRTVMWNATNDMGRLVSAGVYIYSIQAGDFVQNRKMVLMK